MSPHEANHLCWDVFWQSLSASLGKTHCPLSCLLILCNKVWDVPYLHGTPKGIFCNLAEESLGSNPVQEFLGCTGLNPSRPGTTRQVTDTCHNQVAETGCWQKWHFVMWVAPWKRSAQSCPYGRAELQSTSKVPSHATTWTLIICL